MNAPLRKQVNIPNICDTDCLKKLETLISQKFVVKKDSNLPPHIKFKARLHRTGLTKEVHIEVYTNNNVEIKTSPEMQPLFDAIYAEIEHILKEANIMLSKQNVVRVDRARRILNYIQTIPVGNEVEMMVIVTLCDVVLDLLVTEKLSNFTHDRKELEDESVGAKIGLLEKKYECPIYRPKAIRDIRELRNKIAHGAIAIAREETIFAFDATKDIFALI